MSAEDVKIVISALGGGVLGFIGAWIKLVTLNKKYRLEDTAERVVHELLHQNWPLRSFRVIRHHVGGFSDTELRKLLVRAGAIRFMSASGRELWGLLDRNRRLLGVTRVKSEPANFNEDDVFDFKSEGK
jgi:hypothetical protein